MQWNCQKTRLRSVEQGDKKMINSRERGQWKDCVRGMLSKQKQEPSQPSKDTRCGVLMGLRPSQQPPTQS